jgi:hypothetical protein
MLFTLESLPPEARAIAARAYIAGLVDGDGTIGIKRRLPSAANRMASPKYSAHVGVAMTDRAPVEFVAAFCGAPERVTSRARKNGYKTMHEFSVENDRAAALLTEIQPFLVGKQGQAALVLELAALRKQGRANRTRETSSHQFAAGRNKGSTYRVFGLSHEYLDRCDCLYQASLVNSPRSGQPGRFGSRPC